MGDERSADEKQMSGRNRRRDRKPRSRSGRAAILVFTIILSVAAVPFSFWWVTSGAKRSAARVAQVRHEWRKSVELGRLDEARPALVEYLDLVPDDWRAREVLADVNWRRGNSGAAFEQLTEAAKLSGPDAGRQYRLGLLARELGEATAAIEHFMQAAKEEPQRFLIQAELAKALAGAGRYNEAVDHWTDALTLLPEGATVAATVYREIGGALQLSGEETAALESYTRAGVTVEETRVAGGPETLMTELPRVLVATDTTELQGLALGAEDVQIVIEGDDGRFWDSHLTTWSPEPVLHQAKILNRTGKAAFWALRWSPPTGDGSRLVLTATARDATGKADPTPAAMVIVMDDQPPIIGRFEFVDGPAYVARRTSTIFNEVGGAVWMRFAEDPRDLSRRPYRPFSTTATVRLSGLPGKKTVYGQWKDAAGNESALRAPGSFTSVTLDTRGPEVASMFPPSGATKVNIDVLITANFDEPIFNKDSLSEETFQLLDAGGRVLPASVEYGRFSKVATLSPLEPLRYGQEYQVVLSGSVEDELGNALGNDWRWSFTTIDVSTHAPGRPQGLVVVSGRAGNILAWEPPITPDRGGDFDPPVQGGYNVYIGNTAGGANQPVNKVPITAIEFTDAEYGAPGIYFYTVRAVDAGGSESRPAVVRSNKTIDASFKFRPAGPKSVRTTNGVLQMEIADITETVTVKVRSHEVRGAPPSPIRTVELRPDRPARLRRLTLTVPGDPRGALILKSRGGGWQPLPSSRLFYDPERRSVSYGPVVMRGSYALVNPFDRTLPSTVGRLRVKRALAGPVINWGRSTDSDSGIKGYRLYLDAAPAARPLSSRTVEAVEESSGSIIFDLPADAASFTDHRGGTGRRSYAVAAINGSGLIGLLKTVSVTVTAQPESGHRPMLVDAGSCRACHLSRVRRAVRDARCGLCHDGTGSRVALLSGESGRRSCRACHALTTGQLARADSSTTGACGGCHDIIESNMFAAVSSHETSRGLSGIVCGSCHGLHPPDGRDKEFLVDPTNTRRSWRGSGSDFCLVCHGGRRLPSAIDTPGTFVPRTINLRSTATGTVSSGLVKSGWSGSTHNRIAECLTCHDPHNSPNQKLIAFRKKSGRYVYFSPETAADSLCLQCHQRTSLSSSHGTNARCIDCHDVHETDSSRRRPGSNRVSGPIRGSVGIAPLNGGPGSVPDWLEVTPATFEYQVCFRCHISDLPALFNPANPSFHPVESPIGAQSVRPAAFANGWVAGSTMYCSDCHRGLSGSGAQSGPHGSEYRPLLAAPFGAAARRERQNDLCYECHNQDVYRGKSPGSRFSGSGGHTGHVLARKIGCGQCHEAHGSGFTAHLIKIVVPREASGTTIFTHTAAGGTCVASCHENHETVYRYRHDN